MAIPHSPTPGQVRILDLLVEGKTNAEIGATLYLTDKTVKNAVSGLLRNYGFTNRTQLALHWAGAAGPQTTRRTCRLDGCTQTAGDSIPVCGPHAYVITAAVARHHLLERVPETVEAAEPAEVAA